MKKILDENYYQDKWEKGGIYKYHPEEDEDKTYVIDTPPPTVSGALHIGHVFSYTQTDILARFQRMQGKNVFYPMGWDNNGLPTERRVQNLYKITCDSSLSYKGDPDFEEVLSRKEKKKLSGFLPVSRKTFVRVCSWQTKKDQKKYEQLWRNLGLSVDWSQTYETISPHAQFISQKSFLDLYRKGFVENRHTPVFWDTQFKTAVAQADIEDRQKEGFYYDIKFQTESREGEFVISTTRPELLPACVAVTAHPEDERYKKFFHKLAVTPVFSAPVPVLPSTHADPEKGTGVLMVCTFGDMEDVRFWKKHELPLKQVITSEGVFGEVHFESPKDLKGKSVKELFSFFSAVSTGSDNKEMFFSFDPNQANKYYSELQGLRVRQARKKIVEILTDTKYLVSDPKPTEQFVKFYEKGDYPLELIPTRQWYIKILEHKQELLQQGRKVTWHPPAMLKRYEQWVEGLNQDWCISRQRFFGVPFPIWYPLDKNKIPDYGNPILPYSSFFSDCSKKNILPYKSGTLTEAGDKKIPMDPMSSTPADWSPEWKHYTEDQREKAGGFIADTAVMDTWATSSLTPQISSHWGKDEKRHKKLFPADLRPQAHEIIRTWAFYTIVKSFFHGTEKNNLPWTDIAVSGWVMDPEHVKMSKSKSGKKQGTLSPEELIGKYSADAIRYWAGRARLGMDTVYDENVFKAGGKLVVKLNNAFKFVQIQIKGMVSFFSECRKKEREKAFNIISSMDPFVFGGGYSYISAKMDRSWLIYLLDSLDENFKIHSEVDRAWLVYLMDTQKQAGLCLKQFHYSQALDVIEKSFWLFCDNYLELVKGRAYQFTHFENFIKSGSAEKIKPQDLKMAQSAVYSLDLSMCIFVKMLAPYMPYITDHIWSQRYIKESNQNKEGSDNALSVHTSSWFLPEKAFFHLMNNKNKEKKSFDSSNLLKTLFNILEQVRSTKAERKKSLSTPVKKLTIQAQEEDVILLDLCRGDIARSAHAQPENIFMEKADVDNPRVSLVLDDIS